MSMIWENTKQIEIALVIQKNPCTGTIVFYCILEDCICIFYYYVLMIMSSLHNVGC